MLQREYDKRPSWILRISLTFKKIGGDTKWVTKEVLAHLMGVVTTIVVLSIYLPALRKTNWIRKRLERYWNEADIIDKYNILCDKELKKL